MQGPGVEDEDGVGTMDKDRIAKSFRKREEMVKRFQGEKELGGFKKQMG